MNSAGPNTWTANLGNGLFAIWHPKLQTLKVVHKSKISGRIEHLREVKADPKMTVTEFEKLLKDTVDTIK